MHCATPQLSLRRLVLEADAAATACEATTARRDAGAKRYTIERRTYHSLYKMATAATPTRTLHCRQRFDNKCLHHPCAGHNAGRTRRQPSAGMAPFRRRHGRLVISQPTAPPRQRVCADLPTRSDHTNHSPTRSHPHPRPRPRPRPRRCRLPGTITTRLRRRRHGTSPNCPR